jgi:hypothetical protein
MHLNPSNKRKQYTQSPIHRWVTICVLIFSLVLTLHIRKTHSLGAMAQSVTTNLKRTRQCLQSPYSCFTLKKVILIYRVHISYDILPYNMTLYHSSNTVAPISKVSVHVFGADCKKFRSLGFGLHPTSKKHVIPLQSINWFKSWKENTHTHTHTHSTTNSWTYFPSLRQENTEWNKICAQAVYCESLLRNKSKILWNICPVMLSFQDQITPNDETTGVSEIQ